MGGKSSVRSHDRMPSGLVKHESDPSKHHWSKDGLDTTVMIFPTMVLTQRFEAEAEESNRTVA